MHRVCWGVVLAGVLVLGSVQTRAEPGGTDGAEPPRANGFLRLDGRSALRVDLAETPEVLTLEAWVRGGPAKGRQGLLCNTEASGFAIFWSDAADGAALPSGFVHTGEGYASAGADRPWDFARWTHIALSYNGARVRFFVNGRLTEEAAARGPVKPNGLPLMIGADMDAQGRAVFFWRGDLDEVRLSRGARYTGDFEPARRLIRDADTVVLLNFDEPLEGDAAESRGGSAVGIVGTPRVILAGE